MPHMGKKASLCVTPLAIPLWVSQALLSKPGTYDGVSTALLGPQGLCDEAAHLPLHAFQRCAHRTDNIHLSSAHHPACLGWGENMGPEGTVEGSLQKAHGLSFLSQGWEAKSKKLLREAWEGAREGHAELSGMSKALKESVR